MRTKLIAVSAITAACLAYATVGFPYVFNNWWPDAASIVMDDVFLPAATFSDPAQFQMSEWNEVDTTDNSHPFQINTSPEFSFGADDGDNTIGFLGEAGLNSEFGLSYASALAWAVCRSPAAGARYDECDVMLDPSLPWSLDPDDDEWFQSTVLHELGHVRGLGHYNSYLSIENSGVSKYLRGETLYADDKEGVRQNASHVSEKDIVIYNKWHDGSVPRWMSMTPTTLREGETVSLSNITVENRGTQNFSTSVRFGTYLSTNDVVSTGDQLINTGSFSTFNRYTFSTFNWSVQIPTVDDCGVRYLGGIIDDNNQHAERYESNNAVPFTNGVPYTGTSFTPTPLTIQLARDPYEPNDARASAPLISLPFSRNDLSIDTDQESDFFRLSLGTPGTLSISSGFSHASGDVDVSLLDSSGTAIASSASTSNNESIQRSVAAGTYYVQVYGFGSGSCNRYSLSVQLAPVAAANPDTTGVFRPSNGALYLKNQNSSGFANLYLTYGIPGDYPVAGDWNGDGIDTIGVYRNGTFYLRNSNTNGIADLAFSFGTAGDQPVVGDWNGDGVDTIGIFRNGTFYLRNSNSSGSADLTFSLGVAGDVGIAGDWNGDGIATTGVFRPTNGALYLKNTNSTGFADLVLTYGLPGDRPVTGDWDGDGDDTIGVYRNGTFYLRNSNTNGFAELVFSLGVNGDIPIAGDWDGLP